MKYGLKAKTIKTIHEIFKKFPAVEKVVLYGSRAMGNFRNGSDIDLTLLGKGLNSDTLSKIQSEFEDSWLPYKFDISIFSQLTDPDFIDRIKCVGAVFYERK